MKKKFLIPLSLIAIFGSTLTLQAKTDSVNIPVKYNNIKITVDGKEITTSNEPFIYNGVTYLPVRDVANATGKNVDWDSATKTVKLTSKETTEQKPVENNSTSKFKDFSVNIRDDFYLTKDRNGKDILAVRYDFTNFKDDPESFNTLVDDKVFQNGIELSSSYSYSIFEEKDESAKNYIKDVLKNSTVLVTKFYELKDTTSDVTVQIKKYFDFYNNDKITKTLKLSK